MAKKLSIKPIGANILVRAIKPEEKTTSGLIIQTNHEEKSQKGEIVALGTGARDDSGKAINWNVKVGDVVLFKKYSPEEVEIEGEDYLIMKENDILAIIG